MFTYELEAWNCKQMTVDAWRLEDWFTNELFEDIAEDGRIFIGIRDGEDKWKKENKPWTSTGQRARKRNKDDVQKKKGPDKNTNKELEVKRGDSWHTVVRKAYNQPGRLVMKIQSVTLNWEVSLAMNLLGRPSAPQAKVNTHRRERATRHRYAKNYSSASLSLNMKAWLIRLNTCGFNFSLTGLDTDLWPDSNR